MTVKAFIKSEEKKRSKDTETAIPQSVETATPTVAQAETPAPAVGVITTDSSAIVPNGVITRNGAVSGTHVDEQNEAIPTTEVRSLHLAVYVQY